MTLVLNKDVLSPTLFGLYVETYMGLEVHHVGVEPATTLEWRRAVAYAR